MCGQRESSLRRAVFWDSWWNRFVLISLFFLEHGCISLPLRHFYSIVLFLTLPSYFSCCLNNCPAGVVRVLLRLVLIDRR